jgi:hypothetical protein
MAGGRRLIAHERRGGDGFYSWAQGGGGASLCAKATKIWCGPRHGRSTVERGRRRAAAVKPMAALGRHGVASAHARHGSAKDPQTSRTGTKEHGARTAGRGPASGASSAAMSRARGVGDSPRGPL